MIEGIPGYGVFIYPRRIFETGDLTKPLPLRYWVENPDWTPDKAGMIPTKPEERANPESSKWKMPPNLEVHSQAFGLTFSKPKYTKKPAMPRSLHALFLFGLLASPALASPALDKHLDAMAGATTEQAFFVAAEELLQLGPQAIPDLTQRLLSAEDENTRIDLTFILASIMEQARLKGRRSSHPPS